MQFIVVINITSKHKILRINDIIAKVCEMVEDISYVKMAQ